jgi:predicted transcriptional regulator
MTERNLLRQVRRQLPPANEKAKLEAVAKGSGVPFHTLLKIVKGQTANPRILTVQKLLNYVYAKAA